MSIKKIVASKFDYDISDLGTYVDEQSDVVLTKQVTEGRTLSMINIQTGIKQAEKIKTLDDSVVWQGGEGCGFNADGDTKFSDRTITVYPIKVNKKWCNEDLVGTWGQLALKQGMADQNNELPFGDLITSYFLQLNARELELAIWNSNISTGVGNLSFFDGFRTVLSVSNGCVDLNPNSVSAITTSNAYDVAFNAYVAMQTSNPAIADNANAVMFVGRDFLTKLRKNMIDLNLFAYTPTTSPDSQLLIGTMLTIEAVDGLNGTNEFYFGLKTAFTFGTDLESDYDAFKLWYNEDEDELRLRSKFRAGVQVPFIDEIGVFALAPAPSPSV